MRFCEVGFGNGGFNVVGIIMLIVILFLKKYELKFNLCVYKLYD